MSFFIDAQRELYTQIIKKMKQQEELALMNDGRGIYTPQPFVPCPETIGNDPCDDWSEPEDEYDW